MYVSMSLYVTDNVRGKEVRSDLGEKKLSAIIAHRHLHTQ